MKNQTKSRIKDLDTSEFLIEQTPTSKTDLIEDDDTNLQHKPEVSQLEPGSRNYQHQLAKDKAKSVDDKFIAINDFTPGGYFILDYNGKIYGMNFSGTKMLEKNHSDLINKNFRQFITQDTTNVFNKFLEKVFETNSKHTCKVNLTTSGNPSLLIHMERIDFNEGEKCLLTAVDITERNQIENELLKERDQLKTIIDASPTSIWFKDTKNNFITINKAAAKIANRAVKDVEGHSTDEIFPIESSKYYKDDLEVLYSGKPKLGIIEPVTTDGITTWVRTDKIPWYDAKGNIAGVVAYALDITDNIRAQKKLQSSETRYRRLFESAKDGILILDAETGQIDDVNPFLIELLGYSKEEFLDKMIWEIGIFKDITNNFRN